MKIKLFDFLLKYNFRTFSYEKEDSRIVRIYLDTKNDMSNWIELGVNDFGAEYETKKLLLSSLKDELLNKEVSTFYVDEDTQVLHILLNN